MTDCSNMNDCKYSKALCKFSASIAVLSIALAGAYFLCSNANIGRYQYYNFEETKGGQYVLDTTTGKLRQTVCGKFAENGSCEFVVLKEIESENDKD